MNLHRIASILLVLAAVAGVSYAGSAGGQTRSSLTEKVGAHPVMVQDRGVRDFGTMSCDMRFDEYFLGPSFQRLEVTHVVRACSDPEPERTQRSGGGVDPASLGRAHHYVTTVYGNCQPKSDSGCAPPLQVQVWPSCERSPADYTYGEPETATTLPPTDVVRVRGVPGRFYGGSRLEISTGDTTVVLFGDSRERLIAAAQQLRTRPGSRRSPALNQDLPAPTPGAEEGTLTC